MTTAPVLQHAPFRWLVLGIGVNSFGNGIAPVALAFGVLDLGGGAGDLGLVLAAYAVANVAAVLFGGLVGDRFARRTIMQVAAFGAAIFQLATALSLIGGWSSLTLLASTGFAIGALGALGGPSSSAITQQTVPPDLLRAAVVWRRLIQNVALILGSGAAGLLVVSFGSGWALLCDAATFAVGALLFGRIRVGVQAPPTKSRVLSDFRAGFREVLRHTWLWLLIGQALLYHLFYGGAQGVLGPIVVGDSFGRAAWGWALATTMAGFVVGGLVTIRWRPRRALYVGVCFLSLTAAFPLAMALSDSLLVVLFGAALHGFGLEIFSVGWDLSIQENVEPGMLARVYAFDLVGSFVARPVGLALTGPLSLLVGQQTWLIVVGVVILASVGAALMSREVRSLQRRGSPPPKPQPIPGPSTT